MSGSITLGEAAEHTAVLNRGMHQMRESRAVSPGNVDCSPRGRLRHSGAAAPAVRRLPKA